jgi:beta-glucosidase
MVVFKAMPSLDFDIVTPTGRRCWLGTWHRHESGDSMIVVEEPVQTMVIDETRILLDLSAGAGLEDVEDGITRKWTLRLRGQLVPREKDMIFEFGLIVAGRAKVFNFSYWHLAELF